MKELLAITEALRLWGIFAVVLVIAGIGLTVYQWRQRRAAGWGQSLRVRDQDADRSQRGGGTVLYDPTRRIFGKPDYISEERRGGRLQLVAIEAKPTRRSKTLREGDEMQALIYLLLLRATWPQQAADVARVTYAPGFGPFEVKATPEALSRLDQHLTQMRLSKTSRAVARSHNQAARCNACSMASSCGLQRLTFPNKKG